MADIRTRIVIDADARAAVKALDAVDKAAGGADAAVSDIPDRVDVDTRRAVGNLDDVESAADDADRAVRDVTDRVDITADSTDVVDARTEVDRLRDLARDPVRVSIDLDDADVSRVKRAGDEVRTIGVNAEGLQRGVGPLRGFTDELGGAAGAAGTATNALIDAGEAVEIFGAQLGLSQQTLGRVSLALGGIGLAVGAATWAWSQYRQAQDAARERAEKLIEVQRQLADGKYREAAEQLTEQYGELFTDAIAEGLSYQQVVDAITSDSGALTLAVGEQGRVMSGTYRDAAGAVTELSGITAGSLEQLRQRWQTANDELTSTEQITGQLESAFKSASDEADETARSVDTIGEAFDGLRRQLSADRSALDVADQFDRVEEAALTAWAAAANGTDDADAAARDYQRSIIDAKSDVLDLVTELGNVPEETTAEVLALIDEGSFDAAENRIEELTKERTVNLSALWKAAPNLPYFPSSAVRPTSAPSSTTVNQTIIVRATPAMRDVDAAASRWRRIDRGT